MDLPQSTLLLVNVLATPVVLAVLQGIKRVLGIAGKTMEWFAFVFCFGVGIAIALVTGIATGEQLASPFYLFGSGSAVFAITRIIYRTVADKLKLSGDIPK